MKMLLLTLLPLFTFLPCYVSVRCVDRDGELVLQQDGVDIPPGPFPCIRARTTSTKETVTPFTEDDYGTRCRVRTTSQKSTRYTRSELNTGTYCKYKCVNDEGYRCNLKHHKDTCGCKVIGPRAVTVGVVGKGLDKLGETCDDKYAGYEFADAVACTRVKGEFRRDGMVEIEDGVCERRVRRVVETRFMRTERAGKNLEGCVYVCKEGLLGCDKRVRVGGRCGCRRKGLRKVLIGLEEGKLARMEQTECSGDDCGPCGECVKGECVLRKEASKRDLCECGEICPEEDVRTGNKGGRIFCEPNMRLGCGVGRKWLSGGGGDGKSKPDLCLEGGVDAADRCGCADGYEQVLEKYGGARCEEATRG